MDKNLQNCGNGLIELVLFIPVAFFFLFVVIDAGLYLRERALMNDVVRSALHSISSQDPERELIVIDDNLNRVVNHNKAREILNSAVDDVLRSLEGVKSPDRYALTMTLLEFGIDPNDGQVLHRRTLQEVSRPNLFSLPRVVPDYPYLGRDDYLDRLISNDDGPSPFAVLSGLDYDPAGQQGARPQFSPSSLVVYAQVEAAADGIASGVVESLLGRQFGIQSQGATVLRGRGL